MEVHFRQVEKTMTESKFDTIIIGGGSAGCVLANRLTEDKNHNVLVLEAGRPDSWWDILIHMPSALMFPIGNKHYDWRYTSEPEPFMNGRCIKHARGKVFGGSGSINGMIFLRGNPMDFQKWAQEPGMENWDYAHCLPYFIRSESIVDRNADYRGAQGPMALEPGPCTNPLFKAFFAAAQQAGYPFTQDVNGKQQEGFGAFDRNIRKGRRHSPAGAYVHPVARKRNNLTVACRVFVRRILFEGKRAVAVEYEQGGQIKVTSAKEIICCGGSINTPQLLQLSGVGNALELSKLGITVVHDLPGVGENLQDHLEVYIQYACKKPVSEVPSLKWWRAPWIGLQWLLFRSGPGATNHFEAGGFIRSNEDVPYPNVQFHFLPLSVRYDGSQAASDHGYQVHVGPTTSDARGSIKLQSNDPHVYPALRFNYLSTEQDRREWVESIACARHILSQPAMDEFNGGEVSPGLFVQSDKEILDWVARDGETALHPACTCKMGTDHMSVVDPKTMRVRGLEGLRVVDASVMPYVTNGNLNAPVIMIAEKAADIIRGITALPPVAVPFYRHDPGRFRP